MIKTQTLALDGINLVVLPKPSISTKAKKSLSDLFADTNKTIDFVNNATKEIEQKAKEIRSAPKPPEAEKEATGCLRIFLLIMFPFIDAAVLCGLVVLAVAVVNYLVTLFYSQ